MAEKYGTIPKRFTKKWWEYFWDYYKIHVIVVVCIILAIGITVKQIMDRPKFDFEITYSAENGLTADNVTKIKEVIMPMINDYDSNGSVDLNIDQHLFDNDDSDGEMQAAKITKLQLELVDCDSLIYIFDKEKAKHLINIEASDGAFCSVYDWVEGNIDEESVYKYYGRFYAISLKDSKILKNAGIDTENLYISLLAPYKVDKDSQKYIAAVEIANELIK